MNYLTFLIVAVIFVGCSYPNDGDQVNKILGEVVDPLKSRGSISFEGKVYLEDTDSTYLFEEDSENWSLLVCYPNGQIKNVFHQGEYASCGMAIGIHKKFDSTGILLETIEYKNWLLDGAEGCHETIQEEHIIEYFPSGGIKRKMMFQNCFDDLEIKAGIWQEFDESGSLLSSENYGLKYKK